LRGQNKLFYFVHSPSEVKKIKERIFNNPRTKKIEKISPINKIVFKQGKILKKKFNEEI